MPPRSKYCLFCGIDCSHEGTGEEEELLNVKLSIPGSGRCQTLNRQLENWFVTRVLLEVDNSFLGSQLPEGGHPLSWFRLCEGCRECEVKPAWAAHQKLLQAEEKLREVRGRVKREMEDTIWRRLRKHKEWGGWRGRQMEARIRRQVFKDHFGGKVAPEERTTTREEKVQHSRPRPTYSDIDPLPVEDENTPAPADDDWLLPDDSPDEAELENDVVEEYDAEDDVDYRPKKRKRSSPSKKRSLVLCEETGAMLSRRKRKKKPRHLDKLKRFKCLECGSYLNSHSEYTAHLEAHDRSKAAGGLPFDCPQCSFPCASSTELQNHTYARHQRKKFRCPKCPTFMVKTWAKLSAHILSEHPAVTEEERDELCNRCTLCQRQFTDRGHWILHRQKMHPTLTPGDGPESCASEPQQCSECPQRFVSQVELNLHINTAHKADRNRFVCEECGKGFPFRGKLARHKLTHTRKLRRDYVCDLCGVDYAYPEQLTDHHRKYHQQEAEGGHKVEGGVGELFKCRHCDLTSPYKVVISRHLKTHKEASGYRCDVCGNTYMTEVSLKRHYRLNHTKSESKVLCPYCRKEFPNQDYMKTHVSKFCKLKGVTPATEESIGAGESMEQQQMDFGGEGGSSQDKVEIGEVVEYKEIVYHL